MKHWLVLVLTLAVAVIVYTVARRGTPPPVSALSPEPLAVGLRIPEFKLTDLEGRPADHSLFEGRVTVLDFMFTNCPFACPMMTAAMIQVAGDLQGTPIQFVRISVDPAHDTPARLREYAARLEMAPPRWTLLTGDEATIKRIIHDALQFELGPDPERPITLPDGSTMSNITHPTRLLLVGPDRRVLGFYDHNIPEDMDRLKTRARLAARQLVR